MVLGAQLMVLGAQLMVLGARLMVLGARLMVPGAQLMVLGARWMVLGARLMRAMRHPCLSKEQLPPLPLLPALTQSVHVCAAPLAQLEMRLLQMMMRDAEG